MFILSLQKAGKKMCETHVCKYITSTFLLLEKVAAYSPLLTWTTSTSGGN